MVSQDCIHSLWITMAEDEWLFNVVDQTGTSEIESSEKW
jgi:hypothetical protein